MPRIRTIKPDFWDSPDTAVADLRTRLLYIAMWNWADDYGIGDATPVRIIGFAFPNDPIPASDYPRLLADVSSAFGVVFFDHLGRRYYVIPAWDQHQRTEKKAKPKDGLLEAATAAAEDASVARQSTDAEPPQKASENPPPREGSSDAGSRKGEVGKGTEGPPYPPEPEPERPQPPARRTGSEIARSRFTAIETVDSSLARQIAQAYNDSLRAPLAPKLLREVGEQIDVCLRAQNSPDDIARGIEAWTESASFAPSQIPAFVHKANNGRRPTTGISKPTTSALDYQAAGEALLAKLSIA